MKFICEICYKELTCNTYFAYKLYNCVHHYQYRIVNDNIKSYAIAINGFIMNGSKIAEGIDVWSSGTLILSTEYIEPIIVADTPYIEPILNKILKLRAFL